MINEMLSCLESFNPPCKKNDMLGFVIDTREYFTPHPVFRSVTIKETGDNTCLLDIQAEVSTEVSSIQKVNSALFEVWKELAYSHFQASSCEWFKELMVFRFFTVISSDSWYVNGKVAVDGAHYRLLADKFESEFEPLKSFTGQ